MTNTETGTCFRPLLDRSHSMDLPLNLVLLIVVLAGVLASQPARASDVCAVGGSPFELLDGGETGGDGDSGIGGTGRGPDDSGIGGTGRGSDDSGIGGTGIVPRPNRQGEDESGIGGTGIVGSVTHLDRLCVNGLEIEVPESLQLLSQEGSATSQALMLGQTIWVRAETTDGGLVAQEIQILEDHATKQIQQILDRNPDLDQLSVEARLTRTGDRLFLLGLAIDLDPKERRRLGDRLRSGVRVRATGRLTSDRVLRIDRPGIDSAPDRGEAGLLTTEPRRLADADTTAPRPSSAGEKSSPVRPDTQRPEIDPPERFDRPTRPDILDRPKRPTRPERPIRPSIDRVLRPESRPR